MIQNLARKYEKKISACAGLHAEEFSNVRNISHSFTVTFLLLQHAAQSLLPDRESDTVEQTLNK